MIQKEAHTDIPSPWEEFAVFVEADCHDSVCCVEGFLYTISMVDVDVDVQHPRVIPVLLY